MLCLDNDWSREQGTGSQSAESLDPTNPALTVFPWALPSTCYGPWLRHGWSFYLSWLLGKT